VDKGDCLRLERYLRRMFRLDTIEVRRRPQKDDSAEVYVGDEFVGIMFEDDDDEDDEKSFSFQMSILDFDLKDG
jgi:hypothetical protein